ncbi:MAG: tRNA preQ1(34) S-adenosylmethionine ribosyltransferase-isomerase QueA [Acidimicrobiales bacterium]
MADFDYPLPVSAIAQHPAEPRDSACLLVDRGQGHAIGHFTVADLPGLLRPGDLVVVNDTRVLPARLRLRRATGGRAEVLLLEPIDDDQRTWRALVRPGRRLRPDEVLVGDDGRSVVGIGVTESDGTRRVTVLGDDVTETINRHGEMPLPPYITAALGDPERYQTVYARRPASAAAPTAGLHLTTAVLDSLAARGIGVARVELVVGLDTFRPVTVDDPRDHRIHSEAISVSPEVLEACERAERVVAVGTTTARALESAARGTLSGRTSLFIRAPFEFRVVDVLLTNFHLPRSSLLLLVHAFIGDRWRILYDTALAEGYRFFSFGDAMLLERAT